METIGIGMEKLELNINVAYDKMKWKERIHNPDFNSLRSQADDDDDDDDDNDYEMIKKNKESRWYTVEIKIRPKDNSQSFTKRKTKGSI